MKLFPVILSASVFALSFGVQAAVITSTSSYDYPSESMSDTQTDTSNIESSSVSAQVSSYGGEWGPMATSEGNSEGAFRLRAGGSGYGYTAQSSFSYATSFTNAANSAQNAFLDLNFDEGSLAAGFYDVSSSSADLEIHAQVFVNDVMQWETGAFMQADSSSSLYNIAYYGDFASNSSVETNGVGNGGLNWGTHSYTVDLGLIDALTSFDLRYVVSVFARDFGTDGSSYTHAGMGDPFNVSFDNSSISFVPATGTGYVSVSEPSGLALLGFGLFLLNLKRRKS